ncbi:hypothetical protein ACLOJK_002429 [Asimina triloba]
MGVVRNGFEEEKKEEEDRKVVVEREIAKKKMEWEQQQQQQQQQQEQQQEQQQQNGVMYVKVMTDEQMELLRRQISVYATICEQLVEMHKAITAQQDSISGLKLGNIYCDPLMASSGHKITARQRWTPTPVQLQTLESIFEQGNGTPSKQRIKEITSDLSQHGQISETNVYNWFQNRRARSKRKQLQPLPNSAESEVETETESPKEKKAKPENILSHEKSTSRADDMCFQSSEIGSELHSLDPQSSKAQGAFPLNDGSNSSGSLGRMPFYENVLSNPRVDHPLIGKMEVPGSFSPFRTGEGFDMIGMIIQICSTGSMSNESGSLELLVEKGNRQSLFRRDKLLSRCFLLHICSGVDASSRCPRLLPRVFLMTSVLPGNAFTPISDLSSSCHGTIGHDNSGERHGHVTAELALQGRDERIAYPAIEMDCLDYASVGPTCKE